MIFCMFMIWLVSAVEGSDMLHKLPEETAFVSKVEPHETKPCTCECYNTTENFQIDVECTCSGKELQHIPDFLNKTLTKLVITDSDIKRIRKDELKPYRDTLKDVTLGNLPYLRVIEDGTFADIPNLRTLYISHAPQLKFLDGLLMGVTSKKFYSLRIVQTGLAEVPDLSYLPPENVMHLLDLDLNKIDKLKANSVKIQAEQVTLNYNEITVVEDLAFNGSQIGKLNLGGNKRLKKLEPNAFKGLQSLRELDLSSTSIENLPVVGLGEIETLRIEDTPSMKVIPSIYDLENLKVAKLTHPFHCCAFKYPEQHNPERHAQYEETTKRACKESTVAVDTGQPDGGNKRTKRWFQDDYDPSLNVLGYEHIGSRPLPPKDWTPNLDHFKGHPNKSDHSHLNPLRGRTIDHEEARPLDYEEDFGTFHAKSAEIPQQHKVYAVCGNLAMMRTPSVKCYPEANALNPCEDIMGFSWLRISVWFVVVLAVVGNLAVIVVVLFSGGELTVNRFLMCNLAFADFCMGLYLLLIASMDLHSVGTYFNFAFDWQYGFGCKLAGFLTVFSCHLSIFTLTIITLERWFAITYAIHLTRRIRLGAAAKTMLGGWMYSILVASLPLVGVSNYSSTSICLPMEVNRVADRAYLYSIILVNAIAFALIAFCYAQIYLSLGQETRHEMAIAKKFALLVFTDFATWAPISFFSVTALAGYPLIGVTKSKILLVFFYPINSCANPYLYAIMTAQYRKDFFILLSRCGLCKKKAQKYTLTTSNNSHPIPLLQRSNGQCQIIKANHIDDTLI
ncbi:follicle-stimulating hormone receptor isoform X2 [Tribolium castaneum]|nr:PREDICTED: follicle-stimulating hormone receptor isoform X2 [Tribolium castaneum]EFA07460.2 Follicle-stimulating hormone receptor-like Protein [Tribolium castaneum]|eukprot:XP_015836901.1 PREDICTED: follicle-stimulating hormone receptor isoform X2 [Tribolium castaneum]